MTPHITSKTQTGRGCCERGSRSKIIARANNNIVALTWDSVGAVSSSLSGAAPKEAPGRFSPVPMPRLLARFSSRLALRISTCCSSRRRRSSSGLNVFFALNCVRRCSGMYRSAMLTGCCSCAGQRLCEGLSQWGGGCQRGKEPFAMIGSQRCNEGACRSACAQRRLAGM